MEIGTIFYSTYSFFSFFFGTQPTQFFIIIIIFGFQKG